MNTYLLPRINARQRGASPAPPGGWTEAAVWARYVAAAQTLKRLPTPRDVPHGYISTWPDPLANHWDAFAIAIDEGGPRPTTVRPSPPTSGDISDLDEATRWALAALYPGILDWKVLWTCAVFSDPTYNRVRFTRVAGRIGVSKATVYRRHKAAIRKICLHLNPA